MNNIVSPINIRSFQFFSFLFMPRYEWNSIDVNQLRNNNITKSNKCLCTICKPNQDNHKMRVQRGRCISKQCGDTCPVEYKIEQCLPTSHLTHAMRNEHLAAVEPQPFHTSELSKFRSMKCEVCQPAA